MRFLSIVVKLMMIIMMDVRNDDDDGNNTGRDKNIEPAHGMGKFVY